MARTKWSDRVVRVRKARKMKMNKRMCVWAIQTLAHNIDIYVQTGDKCKWSWS